MSETRILAELEQILERDPSSILTYDHLNNLNLIESISTKSAFRVFKLFYQKHSHNFDCIFQVFRKDSSDLQGFIHEILTQEEIELNLSNDDIIDFHFFAIYAKNQNHNIDSIKKEIGLANFSLFSEEPQLSNTRNSKTTQKKQMEDPLKKVKTEHVKIKKEEEIKIGTVYTTTKPKPNILAFFGKK